MHRFRPLAPLILLLIPSPAAGQSANIGANFEASRFGVQSTAVPPNTAGAIGPNHFAEMIDGRFRVYNKGTGAQLFTQTLDGFWTGAANSPGVSSTLYPRILYDRGTGRWYAAAVDNRRTAASNILVGVSATADPTGPWTRFSFDADPGDALWADFPGLGVSRDRLTVTANLLTTAGDVPTTASVLTIPAASLVAGTATGVNYFRPATADRTGFSAQPVLEYERAGATDYLVSRPDNTALRVSTVSGPVGNPTVTTLANPPLAATDPPVVTQRGGTALLDPGDTRVRTNPVLVNGKLWVLHATEASGRARLQWARLDPATGAVEGSGLVPAPPDPTAPSSAIYGSLAVNPAGDIVVGYTGANVGLFASSYAVPGRFDGTAVTWGTPVQTQAGAGHYNQGALSRWGDYSATTLDPADPGLFWTIQQYASATNTWSNRVTEVIPTRAGEVRWKTAVTEAIHEYANSSNWFNGTVPEMTDHVIVSRWVSTSYGIDLGTTPRTLDRLSLRQGGLVGFDAGSDPQNRAQLTLTNPAAGTPSLAVAEFQGTTWAYFANISLTTVHTIIGGQAGGTGTLSVGSNSVWVNTGDVYVGGTATAAGGTGRLNIDYRADTQDADGRGRIDGTLKIWNTASSVRLANSFGGGSPQLTVGRLVNEPGTRPTVTLHSLSRLTINGATDSTFTGIIAVGDSSGTLVKEGAGTFTLGAVGAASTYRGGTIVTAGTFRLGAANVLPNTGTVTLNGGTLSTGETTGFSDTVGLLDLDASSTIALGTGPHVLQFTSVATGPTGVLTVTGWTGTRQGGTGGKLVFDLSAGSGGANALRLNVVFSGQSGQGEAIFIGTGTPNVVELVPVPEPGLLLVPVAAGVWLGRRRRK